MMIRVLVLSFLVVLTYAQTQTGFIGIDCGLAKGGDYTDDSTGMYYVSDESFIDSGLGSSQKLSSSFLQGTDVVQQYNYLRSFSGATRVCYTLRPSQLSVKFLIRASFLYGNYDGLNSVPSFDLFLGVEKWVTIVLKDAATPLVKEIMHIPSSNYTSLCLVSTGLGTPFISAIEVRPLKNNTYVTTSGSLDLKRRWNFGSTISRVRYPDDIYDRIWPAFDWPELDVLNTTLTFDKDTSCEVDAMKNIKSKLGMVRNWQGDPCLPQALAWDGLTCSYNSYEAPTITSLDLSSSKLIGEIPSYISNLKSLTTLDLSNNQLTGSVPSFLAQMTSLTILNLSGNNLTGPVPSGLVDKSKSGSLTLSVNGNPSLCASTSLCNTTTTSSSSDKTSSVSISIGPIIGGAVGGILLIVLVILFTCWMRRRKPKAVKVETVSYSAASHTDADSMMIDVKNRNFTYSEVLKMTNNFQKVLGKGGFGTVFLGEIDGTQVAVKMLASTCSV